MARPKVLEPKKRGRKTKFRKSFCKVLEDMMKDGATDTQIADVLKIHVSTLYQYLQDYPEFNDARKRGEKIIVEKVKGALIQRALGYEYEETEQKISKNRATGAEVPILLKRVKKQMAPDVGAIIFWLKNKAPDEFKDKFEFDGEALKNIKVEVVSIKSTMPEPVVKDKKD